MKLILPEVSVRRETTLRPFLHCLRSARGLSSNLLYLKSLSFLAGMVINRTVYCELECWEYWKLLVCIGIQSDRKHLVFITA